MQVQQTEEGSITPVELQAELDTLRSLRRRSISQPSEGIDPDLPPSPSKYTHSSPPGSPIQLHHVAGPSEIPVAGPSGSTSGSNSSSSTLGRRTSASSRLSKNIAEEDEETPEDQPLADNLSELFWLPARLHPEIAPQEFRNFIRDQTRPENLLRRSGSHLGRRKSMLSRQYQPSDTETEYTSMFNSDADSTPGTTPSISRRPSRAGSFRRNTGLEKLTLADLQKLETIARQAAEEGQTGDEGEAQLKRLVRRSLSLNPAAILGVADQLRDDDSYIEDESDSPLIVPPPGSILRRSARTKIRKNSLLGDGNGHRFGPSRRGQKGLDPAMEDDPNRPISGRRHSSISSLNSVEEEKRLSQGDRPTSAELRRLSPRSPTKSPRSPDDTPSTPEPLPVQYMPSTGATLAERMEAADLGAQQSDRMTVSPVRAGADMPANGHVASPPLQWTLLPNPTDQKAISPPAPATSTSGSLRTTKRLGAAQPQPSPEVHTRTSSAAAHLLSPPQSNQPVLPSSSETATTTQANAAGSPVSARDDSRPALPTKGAGTLQQTDSRTAPSVRPPTTNQTPRTAPQQSTSNTNTLVQTTPKTGVPSPASQASHKASVSPSQTSIAPKEKEKKSTWAKLGLSRSSKDEVDVDDSASIASTSSGASSTFGRKGKKSKKDKVSIDISPEKKAQAANFAASEKGDKQDASSSFFGGLFGKKKAEQNDQPKRDGSTTPTQMQMPTPPPTASGMLTPDGKYINFYRLPIHIERAVYRLSHIKLANPRRPLYEQVLISNLMFWYLGVINKPVAPPPQAQHRSVPPSQAQVQLNAPAPANTAVPNILPGQPMKQSTQGAGISARPGLVREHSSNSADSHFPENGRASLGGESVFDPGSNNGHRPASHPPMIAKSPSNEISEPDYNMRTRPQTMPAAQLVTQPSETVSPPLHTEESSQYRYQDYILTSGTDAPQQALPNGMHYTEPSAAANDNGSRHAPVEQEARQAKRFSSESLETDDVRFDSRRATTDLDTYDIIAAYADEERRKSLLALSSSGSERETSPTPQALSVSHRNGTDVKNSEEHSQRKSSRVHPAARATPPRQSSVGAIATQPAAYQNHHQHQAPLAPSPRHASKSPPPRAHQSTHSLPTQS